MTCECHRSRSTGDQTSSSFRVRFLFHSSRVSSSALILARLRIPSQTKPVDVQILIVKNTYEHNLFERRQKIAPKGASKLYSIPTLSIDPHCSLIATEFTTSAKLPQEDSALKEVLQSAQYLPRREEGSADPAPLAGSPHFLFPRVNNDNGDAMMVD